MYYSYAETIFVWNLKRKSYCEDAENALTEFSEKSNGT